jgi:hypothetical protein
VTKESGEFARTLSTNLAIPLSQAASSAQPQVSEATLLAALSKAPLVKKEDVVKIADTLKLEVPVARLSRQVPHNPSPPCT